MQDDRISESQMERTQPSSMPDILASIPQMLRLPAVLRMTGLSRSTVYRMVAEHTFPAPVKLAKRAVGWRYDDVWQWTAARFSTVR
jgi:prophage regulatory protein